MSERAIIPDGAVQEMLDEFEKINFRGCIVEIGAFRCGTTVKIAECFPDRTIYALDAFGGPARLDSFSGSDPNEVAEYIKPYPNIKMVQGDIVETCKTIEGTVAAILLDCDKKEPAVAAFDRLIPLMPIGAVAAIDDYEWEDIKKACEVFGKQWEKKTLPSGIVTFKRIEWFDEHWTEDRRPDGTVIFTRKD